MTKLDWNYLQEMELGNGKHGRLVFWEVFCSFLLRLLSCLFLLPLRAHAYVQFMGGPSVESLRASNIQVLS